METLELIKAIACGASLTLLCMGSLADKRSATNIACVCALVVLAAHGLVAIAF